MKLPDADVIAKRPASRYIIATLRSIATHGLDMEGLESVHASAIAPLLTRRWIAREGDHIVPTDAGLAILEEYGSDQARERAQPGPITERVQNLLRYARLRAGRTATT